MNTGRGGSRRRSSCTRRARRAGFAAGGVLTCAAVIGLAGCSGSAGGRAGAAATSTPPATGSPTPSATAPSSPVALPSGSVGGGSAPGGPVPAHFVPVSLSATSASTFWVLGTAPCASTPCTSIVRTADGGAHFVGVPAPRAPLSVDTPTSPGVRDLRFADPRDGWVFGPALWSTHDGAAHWNEVVLPAPVLALEPGAGMVYALVGSQGGGGQWQLLRTTPSRDSWQQVPLPVSLPENAPLPSLTVQGHTVLLLAAQRAASATESLLVSTDGAAHFSVRPAPCHPDLGGTIRAEQATVWAACPTGSLAALYVSQDDGQTFRPASMGLPNALPNSVQVAPASSSVAVAAADAAGLRRTTDAGANWQPVPLDSASQQQLSSARLVGFTTSTVGYVVAPKAALWRTTDAGQTWNAVSF